jgi:hypothetical protein
MRRLACLALVLLADPSHAGTIMLQRGMNGVPGLDWRSMGQLLAEPLAVAEGRTDTNIIEQAIAKYHSVAWTDPYCIPRSRLHLGEFGALHVTGDRSLPKKWFLAFLADKRGAAEAAGIPWADLTGAGGMGIAPQDDRERRLAPETCTTLGLPCGK